MKKTKKYFFLLILILVSIFIGYENPKLVENPKKIFKFFFSKPEITVKNPVNIETSIKEIEANSFTLSYEKVFEFNNKSAFLKIISKDNLDNIFTVFTQEGNRENMQEIEKLKISLSFFTEKNGGIKSVIEIDGDYFLLTSNKNLNCYYAALVRLSDNKQLIKSQCLPDKENIDFAGLGGGYVSIGDSVLLAIGTPAHESEIINNLAQNSNSIFGKIIKIKKSDLVNSSLEKVDYEIYTSGHRNPQGMTIINDTVYSIEHGPHGGDELNLILPGNNYGWPKHSYGIPYDFKNKYSHLDKTRKKVNALFTFLPAVAPSSLSNCPKNLSIYYKNNTCLMGLSLKAMSIIIILLDIENNNVISVEKIPMETRLRHFGFNSKMKLHEDNDKSFYITTDNFEVLKIKFKNLIKEDVTN